LLRNKSPNTRWDVRLSVYCRAIESASEPELRSAREVRQCRALRRARNTQEQPPATCHHIPPAMRRVFSILRQYRWCLRLCAGACKSKHSKRLAVRTFMMVSVFDSQNTSGHCNARQTRRGCRSAAGLEGSALRIKLSFLSIGVLRLEIVSAVKSRKTGLKPLFALLLDDVPGHGRNVGAA